jgi:DNA-binding transcriptional ArsR family regulator
MAYASSMSADVKLAHVASLLADPARARIVLALMDGRARTAKELAFLAGIGAPTASTHLARLRDLGLIAVTPQGRHRYHRIASPLVAEMVEAISAVAGGLEPVARRPAPGKPQLRFARTCYDHLAGRLGVAIADRLRADGLVILEYIPITSRSFGASTGDGLRRSGRRRPRRVRQRERQRRG